mgnify:CR=1 FL=1
MSKHTLTWAGHTFDVYIDASLSFNKPAKNVETFTVPGRNGSLIIDDGTFKNVVITYPVYIRGTFAADFDTIVNLIGKTPGYEELVCDVDSTHFRLGRAIMPESPSVKRLNLDGYFNLAFDCKPQRFLTSGKTAVSFSASGTIANPTGFAALPLLDVTGTGTLTINGTIATISQNPNGLIIDCEMLDCYDKVTGASMNAYVSFNDNDYPALAPGSNPVTLGTGITNVDITPRWWEI